MCRRERRKGEQGGKWTKGRGRETGRRAGRGRGRGGRWRPVDEHRMGTGTGPEAGTVAEMGRGREGKGRRIGSGEAEERRRSARNRKIVVDAMWETGETWVERERKCGKKRVGPVAANPDNLASNKKAGGEHRVLRAQVRIVQVE